MIDGGDAELDRIEILIGDIHAREHVREQGILPGEAAAHAVGEALASHIGLGQLVLVVPAAVIDKLIDVGAVGAVGIAEYAKRGLLDVAAVLRLVGQRVLAHEILLAGFVGAGGKQRRLGQQPGLERQQVAEYARQRDHHVDARTPEAIERDQLRAGEAAIAVVARLRAHQPQRLGDRSRPRS